MNSVLYITLLIALIALVKGDDFYCYSGSSIYELQVQNCKNENTSYTGTWYCGSMKICESYMDSGRECVTTRGCAMESQCYDSNGDMYDGSALSSSNAGMTMYPKCCTANSFPDDDTIAIDYTKICNSSSSVLNHVSNVYVLLFIMSVTVFNIISL